MRIASVQNQNVYRNNMVQNNNTNNHSPKMKISMNHSSLNTPKAHNPSFGWFIIDDLFFYYKRNLNNKRNAQRDREIIEVNHKVIDDIEMLSKKLRISTEQAKEYYMKSLERGGIEPSRNGKEVGLNKVIGYSKEKLDLIKDVIAPIVEKQTIRLLCIDDKVDRQNVPNGVLIYGPNGRGKSFLIDSLKEHFDVLTEKDKKPSPPLYLIDKRYYNNNFKTYVIDKDFSAGDTEENLKALDVMEKAFEDTSKRDTHAIIFIKDMENLVKDPNSRIAAKFFHYAFQCAEFDMTWIGNMRAPQNKPDWLFDPEVTSKVIKIKDMSDVEMSAVMSYFWAQNKRKDDSDHNKILDYLNNSHTQIYPPDFMRIAKAVDDELALKDYNHPKKGQYRAPVTTQDVIDGIEEYIEDRKDKNIYKTENLLETTCSDEEYIAAAKERMNERKKGNENDNE